MISAIGRATIRAGGDRQRDLRVQDRRQGTLVIGARFTREATPSSPPQTFEIVGVVKNSTYADLKEGGVPVVFLADTQQAGGGYIRVLIRSSLPPAAVTAAMTRALADFDPRIGVAYGVLSTQIRDTSCASA